MVHLGPHTVYRVSKRGLVLASGTTGETVLLEHLRAADLTALLNDDPGRELTRSG